MGKNSKSRGRGNNTTSNFVDTRYKYKSRSDPLESLSQDRRRWHPEGDNRPIETITGVKAKIHRLNPLKRAKKLIGTPIDVLKEQIWGAVPEVIQDAYNVPYCIRRKIRKEVLHALGKTGRGQKHNAPRYTENSKKRCK